jgi:predicted RNA-binding Zn ribbon-like protein
MGEHEQVSDWKDGFLFLANDLALDFLNTRPVMEGEPVELLPDFDALLRWFVAAGQVKPHAANALRKQWGSSRQVIVLAEAMRDFRERLRKAVFSWEAKGSIPAGLAGELNRLMARHPMRTRLKTDGNAASTEMFVELQRPADLFAPLAYRAATLFATADRSRIRQCGNCVLLFRDVSKKGTRHWCSMQLCGNRIKVAAYAARQRRQRQ